MRFEITLRNSIYQPWRSNYIDYAKLKKSLKEDDALDCSGRPGKEAQTWTEADEGAFVDELVNVQLEKVYAFQVATSKSLRERTAQCETKLERWGPQEAEKADSTIEPESDKKTALNGILQHLDQISDEINELEKFSRINFTGFLKAGKKHDRKRGTNYKVRPLLQVRLASLPFNSEDYSPLLYRLSAMYSFVRQQLKSEIDRKASFSDSRSGSNEYRSHKFWVHPENLLEVKTYILRRLPVLVYNPKASKVVEGNQDDPRITSLYFDNPEFSLYSRKISKTSPSSSLLLRWFGHLKDKPEILFEKKTLKEDDTNDEIRFPIKEKYIKSFISGDYHMEKSMQKLRDRQGAEPEGVEQLHRNVQEIQDFIRDHALQPVLRANYTRTAFQIPGDSKVRISIDTNLVLIREDSLDTDRPCRDPEDWHRRDLDDNDMEFPFSSIRKGEVVRFPYALLEIKVQDRANRRTNEWVEELMSSHLVKEAPRFSKFVHGVAQLFDDYVNSFPFWLPYLETDIRRNPEDAFQEEQEKKAQKAEDEVAVGSFLGNRSASPFKAAVGSPVHQSEFPQSDVKGRGRDDNQSPAGKRDGLGAAEENDFDEDSQSTDHNQSTSTKGLRSLFPSFSTSKYARAHREGPVDLPPGVREPGRLIKDSGPVRVEPKVWFANQRTFVKWCHISVLLASLSLGLYNAAGESNSVARGLAVVYTVVAIFAGVWGWWMFIIRSRMIEQRSGKDLDNVIGPMVVCAGLVVALCLNFSFKYQTVVHRSEQFTLQNYTGI